MKALVVGTGTSLDRYDVQYAATKVDLTIAINNAIMMLPNADICYSGSSRWWNYHGPFIDWYKGERICATGSTPYAKTIPSEKTTKGFNLEQVNRGLHSGFGAINLALLRGAKEIYLLGFDMRGFSHFFGEHPEALQDESSVEEWIQELNEVAPVLDALGVEVINCTPKSMLKCFKKLTLGGALP